MALADPQSITIDGVTTSLPRIGMGATSGEFSNPDGSIKVKVSHFLGKRNRHQVRLDLQKVIPDPLFPATNAPRSASIILTIDEPVTGFTETELTKAVVGLCTLMTESSAAKTTAILGLQS